MEKEQSLLNHIEELRKVILISLLFILIATTGSYYYSTQILDFLSRNIEQLVFIAPQEAFLAHIKVALISGVITAAPIVLFIIWRFVSEGLTSIERKYVYLFFPLSVLFFFSGIIFGYMIIVPIAVRFLLGFQTEFIRPMISVTRYLSFVGMLTLSFGVIFELPITTMFATKLGLVTPHFLAVKRRYAVLVIFIIAAILTPPDIVTQCLMAIPLIVLYEIGILTSKLVYRPKATSYV